MDIGTAAKEGKIKIPALLLEADELRNQGKPDEALKLCSLYLNDNYGNIPALALAAHILIDSERIGLAHALMYAAHKLAPEEPVILNNLGICYEKAQNLDDAEKYFVKALARNQNDYLTLTNLAFVYLQKGEPVKSINCGEKAIALAPKVPHARFNMGQAQLLQGNYREGWKNYEANLGKHQGRKERIYGNLPRWTGEANNLTLIAYGEQGIGDEISFASCVPDLQKENTVIIECDHRLANLFRRSFKCDVYGTRYKKGRIEWPYKHSIDATVALGSLPGFYRNDLSDFPGTPYLTADPERRVQWRALLDSLGPKLKVGIAWTGGMKRTATIRRSLELDELQPVLRQDATFISLQYKDSPEIEVMEERHGIKIHHWRHAMQTEDYDDTAALVAELDLVITVQQSAVHLAGGLGVPTWAMIPKAPLWRYGLTGDTMPWYSSVRLYRQRAEWVHTIAEVATDLRKLIASKGSPAAK